MIKVAIMPIDNEMRRYKIMRSGFLKEFNLFSGYKPDIEYLPSLLSIREV
jgi:hypothetical protein